MTNYNGHIYHYDYDVNGNRITLRLDGATTQSVAFSPGSNQITSAGYGYDAAGKLRLG